MSKTVDLVGDIHGQSIEFEQLLSDLGYEPFKKGYRHPERTLIMVGDLIDGTGSSEGQHRVVEIARSMVEEGNGMIVMGNHEFNAICYATPTQNGHYVRPHSEKNRLQHEVFLAAFPFGSPEYQDTIDFFKTLPLWLETETFRVVHACWNKEAMARLKGDLDDKYCLISDEVLQRFGRDEQPLFDDLELILKGPEIKLPNGMSFVDKYGHTRTNSRVRWWYSGNDNKQRLAIDSSIQNAKCEALESAYELAKQFSYKEEMPLFFGHYWLSPESLQTEHKNWPAVCLDYSVARKGGLLVALRLNSCLENSEWFLVERE